MTKNKAGFLQAGIVILIASLSLATLLITKLNNSVGVGNLLANQAPINCPSSGTYDCKWSEPDGPKYCDKEGHLCGDYRNECKYKNAAGAEKFCVKSIDTKCSKGVDEQCIKPSPVVTPKATPTPSIMPTPTRTATAKPLPTKTPAVTITPTVTPTATAAPSKAQLKICKYNDENGNRQVDNGEDTIAWIFLYEYQGKQYSAGSRWWNIRDRGCVTVTVPESQWVRVSEEGKNGWQRTGVYQDSFWAGTGDYVYVPESGRLKTVWFLNHKSVNATPTPSGEPNFCGGTCGSNINCRSGLFCFIDGTTNSGYCRNPRCPTDSSCGCTSTPKPTSPPVLGASTPPQLPKTGSNDIVYALAFVVLAAGGIYLYKKFRLI